MANSSPPMTPPSSVHVHVIELLLSRLLRIGVVTSSITILTGIILIFFHHPSYFTNAAPIGAVIRDMAFPHTLSAVVAGLRAGEGRSIIVLGLFLLIATPVTRVALSILIFLHERDRPFVLITTVVLVLLLISFVLGHAGG